MNRREFVAGAALALSGCGNPRILEEISMPPFSYTLVSDTFTRANSGNLGANWTAISGATESQLLGITSNACVPQVAGGRAASFWNANTFANDQWAEVLCNFSGAGTQLAGVAVRCQPSGDNLYVGTINFSGSTSIGAQIGKTVAGVFSNVGNTTGNAAYTIGTPPLLLRLEVIGTTLNLYINGVLYVTGTDNSFSSGSPGVMGFSTTVAATNWRAGDRIWVRRGTVIAPASGAVAFDNFNRPDTNNGTLSNNWTAYSGAFSANPPQIQDGTASPSGTTNNSGAFWSANAFGNDQFSQVIISGVAGSTPDNGVSCRGGAGDNYYRCIVINPGASGTLQLGKVINGTFTQLAAPTAVATSGFGQVLRFEVQGTTLRALLNGSLITSLTDASLASGAAGIAVFNAVALGTEVNTWCAGNLPSNSLGLGTQEPKVIYDGQAQILSGNVFKMWHSEGWTGTVGIHYGESVDGINWVMYSGNPVMPNAIHAGVTKQNGVYYCYAGNNPTNSTGIDRWTSPDGVHWTKVNTNVIVVVAATWEQADVTNPFVWVEGGTWFMIYSAQNASAQYATGLATSPDGITWTKSGSNPVMTISGGTVACCQVFKYATSGSPTYFAWGQTSPTSNLPSDISLFSSTNLTTWTAAPQNPIIERELQDEGANVPTAGQLADPCVVEFGGGMYLFCDATPIQGPGNFHINLRTMPQTLASYLSASTGITIVGANLIGPQVNLAASGDLGPGYDFKFRL